MNKNNSAICATYRKKLTIINDILASATFRSVKVGRQEQKWVDLCDSD